MVIKTADMVIMIACVVIIAAGVIIIKGCRAMKLFRILGLMFAICISQQTLI